MKLTRIKFINERWQEVENNKDVYWITYQKEEYKERLIEIATDIEQTLLRELKTNDFDLFVITDFKTIYTQLGYQTKLEEFKKDFIERSKYSIDEKRMIKLAIQENEIQNLDFNEYIFTQDRIPRGEKVGYKLAINGENPKIGNLIFNIHYSFDDGKFTVTDKGIARVLPELQINSLERKFSSLHKVCIGYLRAEKVYFLKDLLRESKTPNFPESNEGIPGFEFETETQKIAWLFELGILDTVLSRSKTGNAFVWRRAANIINSFTGINPETIRACLMAIFQPTETNNKNNPLNNPDNILFIQEMRKKFKLTDPNLNL